MKKIFNPFFISGYSERASLCKREELQTLKGYTDHNTVLYGSRRIGKTTLAKQLMAELENSKEYETLYVNLQATQNKEEAIAAITIAVYEKFGKAKSGMTPAFQNIFSQLGVSIDYHPYNGKPIFGKGPKSFTITEKSLAALGQFLSSRKKRMMVVLDEFQQISRYEEGNEEALFRGWVQQHPDINFLFIGSPAKKMMDMFGVKNRPFYQSAKLIPLASIPLQIYLPFIQRHFAMKGRSISEQLIAKIYHLARGETYTVQLLCHLLMDKSKTVKEHELGEVVSEILHQQESSYSDYERMLTRHQWSVLKAIAKEEPLYNPLSKDFVHKHGLGAVSTVSTALKALEKLGLIIQESDGAFLIHDVLLGRWMARLI